jgi:hypothetical protein
MYYFATMYNATIKLPKCKYDVIILLFGNIPINIFQDGVYRKTTILLCKGQQHCRMDFAKTE